MLSIDLFDSHYERRLHEGAVDDLEQHRIDVLNDRMQDLLARARTAAPEMKASLKQQYEKIKDERDSYYRIREAQQGQDVVDRATKMKALTPSKPGVGGAVRDVARGLKNFLQGRAETGPTYEADQKKSLDTDHGVIPTEPLPEAGGGWALDPKTRLELKRRRDRQKTIARHAGRPGNNMTAYERRVAELEAQGLTRSDAQGVADAEEMQGKLREHGGGIGPRQHWQSLMQEDNASEAAEQAILKRIMVAHTDLLQQFGPQKVMQAAEEVAYNVGDVGEIGSSDVSGWVRQVEQILGARA